MPIPLGILAIAGSGGAGLGGAFYAYVAGQTSEGTIYSSTANNYIYTHGWANISGGIGARVHKLDVAGLPLWDRELSATWSGNTSNYARCLAVSDTSELYASGGSALRYTGGCWIAKWNSSGTLQWQRDWGVTAYPNEAYGVSVAKNSSNVEYVVSCTLYYDGSVFRGPVVVAEANGNKFANYQFNGSNVFMNYAAGDNATNSHYLLGWDAFQQFPYLVRLTADGGTVTWMRRDTGGAIDYPTSQPNIDSTSIYFACNPKGGTIEANFLRINKSTGNLTSARKVTLAGGQMYGRGFITDSSGNFYYVSYNNADASIHIIKTNSSDVVQWQRRISVSQGDLRPGTVTINNTHLVINVYTPGTSGNFYGVLAYPLDGSAQGSGSFEGRTLTIDTSSAVLANQTTTNWNTPSISYSGYTVNYAVGVMTHSTTSQTWNKVA